MNAPEPPAVWWSPSLNTVITRGDHDHVYIDEHFAPPDDAVRMVPLVILPENFLTEHDADRFAAKMADIAGSVPDTGQAREPDWEEDGAVGWLLFKGYDVERDDTGTGAPTFRIGDDRLDEARVRQVRDTLTAALAEPPGDTVQAPPSGFWDESGSTSPVIDWSPVQAPDVDDLGWHVRNALRVAVRLGQPITLDAHQIRALLGTDTTPEATDA